jgi:hypothetical protein
MVRFERRVVMEGEHEALNGKFLVDIGGARVVGNLVRDGSPLADGRARVEG